MDKNIVSIEITKDERDFIVDNALNGLWNHCHEQLQKRDLGDIERKNLENCLSESKRLMKKIDPSL